MELTNYDGCEICTSPLDNSAPLAYGPCMPPKSGQRNPVVPTNPSGKAKVYTLPDELTEQSSQPREKKGEALIDVSYTKAMLVSKEIQQALLRPGKKDWNRIRSQVWCFGVMADKVLNTIENSEEIRVKLPTQLQEGVKVMVQLQIERAAPAPQPVVVDNNETVAEYDDDHVSDDEQAQKPNECGVSFISEQLT